jgi:hypothetical protein
VNSKNILNSFYRASHKIHVANIRKYLGHKMLFVCSVRGREGGRTDRKKM